MKIKNAFSFIIMAILVICSSVNVYADEIDNAPYNNDIILYGAKPPTKTKNLAVGSVDFKGTFCYNVYSEYYFITSTGKINIDLRASHNLDTNRELGIILYDENGKKVDEEVVELSAEGRTTTASITFRKLSTTKKYYIQWAAGDFCHLDDYIDARGTISQ